MSRTILGLAAANIAAPCLTVFFLMMIGSPNTVPHFGWPALIVIPAGAIVVGLIGLALYGIPVCFVTCILDFLAGYWDRETRFAAVTGGALPG
jgi:hypothetical protein